MLPLILPLLGLQLLCTAPVVAQSELPSTFADPTVRSIARAALPDARLVELGAQLFADPRLSADGTVSCATCHVPELAFTDRLPVAVGIHQQLGQRNAPTVLGAVFELSQFWDGRAATLEEQAKMPLLNPKEMGNISAEAVVAKIVAAPEYSGRLMTLFKRTITIDDIATAISAYERTQVSDNSPFDQFALRGKNVLSASAQRGWKLFVGRARCNVCHLMTPTSPFFTDNAFHNIGIGTERHNLSLLSKHWQHLQGSPDGTLERALTSSTGELGRFLITGKKEDIGAFKTPSLRNVGITSPYMHDGSLATLWDVMDHYNHGGDPNPFLDAKMEPLHLSEDEIDDVVSFMLSLTDMRFSEMARVEEERQSSKKNVRPERDPAP